MLRRARRKKSVHYEMSRDIEAPFNPHEKIYVKDVEGLQNKIALIKKDGLQKLHLFADFDFTLTRRSLGLARVDNSFNVLEKPRFTGKKFVDGCELARATYGPIEADVTLSREAKESCILEWWKNTQRLMIEANLHRTQIRRAVAESALYFRNGITQLLKTLESLEMKLFVVSAGLKEVVKECFCSLKTQKQFNIKSTVELCMTNEVFNERNIVVGFEEPTIISTNKHLFVSHERYPEIQKGENAIVMGDLIEDLNIVKSLELSQVISIGFCNKPCSEGDKLLEKYMDTFDIVVVNDGNLVHVAELVAEIAGLSPSLQYITSGKTSEQFFHYLN